MPPLVLLAECPCAVSSLRHLTWPPVHAYHMTRDSEAHRTLPGCLPSPKPSFLSLAHLGVIFLILSKLHR